MKYALFYIPVDIILYKLGFHPWAVVLLSGMLCCGVIAISSSGSK